MEPVKGMDGDITLEAKGEYSFQRDQKNIEHREFIKQASMENSAALLGRWDIKDLFGNNRIGNIDMINELALMAATALANEVLGK